MPNVMLLSRCENVLLFLTLRTLTIDSAIIIAENEECHKKPCQNNGTCLSNGNNYTCECVDGFNGNHCEGMYEVT